MGDLWRRTRQVTTLTEDHVQTILLGYDDTPSARAALDRAAELTRALGAKLVVTSVAPVLISVGRSSGLIDVCDPPARHAEALRHARAYLRERGIEAEYVNAIGDRASRIVDIAKLHNADLIIVGSRGSSLRRRLTRESISESVVHKARCAVLVVRTSNTSANGAAGGNELIERGGGAEPERIAA